MFGAPPPRLPQPVTLFLLPKFSMMGFASAVEPLRSANRMSGRALYTWHILSKDGGPVTASNGIPVVPEAGIEKVTLEANGSEGLTIRVQGIAESAPEHAAVLARAKELWDEPGQPLTRIRM